MTGAAKAAQALEPNRVDILAHLKALFSLSTSVDCWIEIAWTDKVGAPNRSRHFKTEQLEDAADFAINKNRQGTNIYVGAALRHGETGSSGRADSGNFHSSGFAWLDFDREGDAGRAKTILNTLDLKHAFSVRTGTIPCFRFQIYFRLDEPALSVEALQPANEALQALFRADAVSDPIRILRLAGTVNYPLAPKKKDRGYETELTAFKANPDVQAYSLEKLAGIGLVDIGSDEDAASNTTAEDPGTAAPQTMAPGNVHNTLLQMSASLLNKGKSDDEVVTALIKKMKKDLGAEACDEKKEEKIIRGMCLDWRKKQAKALAEAERSGLLFSPTQKIDWGRKVKAKLFSTIRYWREDFYTFKDGAYEKIDDDTITSKTGLLLEKAKVKGQGLAILPFDTKMKNVAEAVQGIKTTSLVSSKVEDGSWIDDGSGQTDVVVFPNGRLDLKTNQLDPVDARFFTTTALAFEYEPDPGPPIAFAEFLNQIFDGDGQQVCLTLEVLGYCIAEDCSLQKAFMVLGPRRSGKGTLLKVLTALIGLDNIYPMASSDFGERFGLEEAVGKKLLLVGDARVGNRANQNLMVENILRITGEDPISTDRKNKRRWVGRLKAKIIALANITMKVGDDAGVFATRFVNIQTQVSFYGKEDTTLFEKQLKPELLSILHLCLRALKDLRDRGHFLETVVGAEAQEEMADLSNPVGRFVKEECVLDLEKTIDKDMLYNAYTVWTETNRTFTVDKGVFYASLKATFAGQIRDWRPGSGQNRGKRSVKGIAINTEGKAAEAAVMEEMRKAAEAKAEAEGKKYVADRENANVLHPRDGWRRVSEPISLRLREV